MILLKHYPPFYKYLLFMILVLYFLRHAWFTWYKKKPVDDEDEEWIDLLGRLANGIMVFDILVFVTALVASLMW